jgi:cytochrome c oxidase subunit IV
MSAAITAPAIHADSHDTHGAVDGHGHGLVDANGEYVGPMFDDHDKQYLKVFAGLVVLTAVEVGLSYSGLKDKKAGLAVPLLVLAFIKFAIVAGFFMHLKFDTPLLRRLFVVGGVLAGFCYTLVLFALGAFGGTPPWVVFPAYGAFALVLLVTWVFRGGSDVDAGHAADGHVEAGGHAVSHGH